MNNTYCQAKKKATMAAAPEKRSAVYVRGNYIEFRIFPGIKNTRNLLWRAELLKIMTDNFGCSEKDVFLMMIDKKSPLHKHLRKIFTASTIASKAWDFARHSKSYNNALIEVDRIKGAAAKLESLSNTVSLTVPDANNE
jgi:hypothetical protein